MNVKKEKLNGKIKFSVKVDPDSRRKKAKKILLTHKNLIEMLTKKYSLDKCTLLLSDSDSHNLTVHNSSGVYYFSCPEEKPLDIPVNYVKIDVPIVEAEFPPLVDEEKPKEEKASLSSEELPIGLKKVKKKRTTKKKTEE